MSLGMSNIRASLNKGLNAMEKKGTELAKDIEKADMMNQVDMIKLQQKMNVYTNNSAMYSSLFKSLADTDKNVIHNM